MLLPLGLLGCATYSPLPLDLDPRPVISLQQVVPPAEAVHPFNPADGLDITEVAMIAVTNNPELRVARDDAGIARAQAFSAGLVPDPVLSLSGDHPTTNAPDLVNAFNAGLGFDIAALMRRPGEHRAAQAAQAQAEEELLWKEWQTVAQARLSFVRIIEGERALQVMREEEALFADRQARLGRTLAAGNVTVDSVATNLAELNGIEQKVSEQERKLSQARHDLNALLGLAPGLELSLVGDDSVPRLDSARVRAMLPDLARIRPDLRALQAGYRSQEEKYRAAVIAQFPLMDLGFNRARDTSAIYTNGFNLSLTLPLFNRNRGNIAIEKATRQRLRDEFNWRLNAAASEIEAILDDRALAERQLDQVRHSLAELESMASKSESAFQAGNIDVMSYVSQRDAMLSKRLELLALEQALLEQQVALQALLQSDLPAADTKTSP